MIFYDKNNIFWSWNQQFLQNKHLREEEMKEFVDIILNMLFKELEFGNRTEKNASIHLKIV